jgi:hypothetical protein
MATAVWSDSVVAASRSAIGAAPDGSGAFGGGAAAGTASVAAERTRATVSTKAFSPGRGDARTGSGRHAGRQAETAAVSGSTSGNSAPVERVDADAS